MTREDCLDLLGASSVGRIAFVHEGAPVIVPLTFLLDGESVVMRVATGSRLARSGPGSRCAFEVDNLEPALEAGYSVVAGGVLERVDAEPERARLSHQLVAWAEGDRPVFLRLRLDELSGRWLTPLAAERRTARHRPGPATPT